MASWGPEAFKLENKQFGLSISTRDQPSAISQKLSVQIARVARFREIHPKQPLPRVCSASALGRFWGALYRTMNTETEHTSLIDQLFVFACIMEVAAEPQLALQSASSPMRLSIQQTLKDVQALRSGDSKASTQLFQKCAMAECFVMGEDCQTEHIVSNTEIDEDELSAQVNYAETGGEDHKLTELLKQAQLQSDPAKDEAQAIQIAKEATAWTIAQKFRSVCSRAFASLWYQEWAMNSAFRFQPLAGIEPTDEQRKLYSTWRAEYLPLTNTDSFKNAVYRTVQWKDLPLAAQLHGLRKITDVVADLETLLPEFVNPRDIQQLQSRFFKQSTADILESKETDRFTKDCIQLHLFRSGIELAVRDLDFLASFVIFEADFVQAAHTLFVAEEYGKLRRPVIVQFKGEFWVHFNGEFCFKGPVVDALLVWCNIVMLHCESELNEPAVNIHQAWLANFSPVDSVTETTTTSS